MCNTLDSSIAFRHQWHEAIDLSPRGETIREDFTDPKNDEVLLRRRANSFHSCATHFFLSTKVFTIEERRSRSSLERAMNRNDPLAFDRRDLYCLTQKVMDLKPRKSRLEWFACHVGLECVTAPSLLPLSDRVRVIATFREQSQSSPDYSQHISLIWYNVCQF